MYKVIKSGPEKFVIVKELENVCYIVSSWLTLQDARKAASDLNKFKKVIGE